MNLPIKILGYRLLVKFDNLDPAGGVVLPDVADRAINKNQATVVAVGDGTLPITCAKALEVVKELPVKIGDRVWISPYAQQEIQFGEHTYALISVDDVFAILPEPSKIIQP